MKYILLFAFAPLCILNASENETPQTPPQSPRAEDTNTPEMPNRGERKNMTRISLYANLTTPERENNNPRQIPGAPLKTCKSIPAHLGTFSNEPLTFEEDQEQGNFSFIFSQKTIQLPGDDEADNGMIDTSLSQNQNIFETPFFNFFNQDNQPLRLEKKDLENNLSENDSPFYFGPIENKPRNIALEPESRQARRLVTLHTNDIPTDDSSESESDEDSDPALNVELPILKRRRIE